MEEFLLEPKFGWSKIQIGDYLSPSCSYLTDVPLELIEMFIDWFEKGEGICILNFEEEGKGSIEIDNLKMTFDFSEGFKRYRRSSYEEIVSLAEALTKDISTHQKEWVNWHAFQYDLTQQEEFETACFEFEKALNKLKEYLKMCGKNVNYCTTILNGFKTQMENERDYQIKLFP